MTRHQLLNITLGQTGLYTWNPALPVTRLGEPETILYGHEKGKLFRLVEVARATTRISFLVKEA